MRLLLALALLLPTVVHAQVWTTVNTENYASPDTVLLTVPTNMSITMRWGSGSLWQVHTFAPGTTVTLRENTAGSVFMAPFGTNDPAPGVVKILQIAGVDTSAVQVNGKVTAQPAVSAVGPRGPQGVAGPPGPAGPPGDAGPSGTPFDQKQSAGLIFRIGAQGDGACTLPPMLPEKGVIKFCMFHDGLRMSADGADYTLVIGVK